MVGVQGSGRIGNLTNWFPSSGFSIHVIPAGAGQGGLCGTLGSGVVVVGNAVVGTVICCSRRGKGAPIESGLVLRRLCKIGQRLAKSFPPSS